MLIGARTGVWSGGAKLPYDAEVEWLELVGNRENYRVNTGIVAKSSLLVECKVRVYSGSYILGADTEFTDGINIAYGNSTKGIYPQGSLITHSQDVINGSPLRDFHFGVDTVWRLDSDKLIVDGIKVLTVLSNRSLYSWPIYLFATNRNAVPTYGFLGRFYYLKIWDGEILIADYVCTRKGGVGMIYDRVSESFVHNEGVGSFVIGPDK